MSRNKYDSSTGTLTQIGGWQGVDNALSDTSENPVQNKILKGVLDKTYKDDDTAETTIADGDYFPYYDVSASAKRKTLWSNVISKLKNVFATATTVAPIEATNVASRAYTTGQQFILNGILYRATANISSGGTINTGSGGNATTSADVTSQISNLTTTTTFLQRIIYSAGVAVAANSYASDTIDISYNGYTPIYFAPIGTNHNDAWITVTSVSSNTVSIIVRSISAQTVKGAVNVLYRKSVQ